MGVWKWNLISYWLTCLWVKGDKFYSELGSFWSIISLLGGYEKICLVIKLNFSEKITDIFFEYFIIYCSIQDYSEYRFRCDIKLVEWWSDSVILCWIYLRRGLLPAGWQESFRSTASQLAGDFWVSASRLAADLKVSCQPAGRRHFLYLKPMCRA